MKKHSNSGMRTEQTSKRTKWRGPAQRETKEAMAELVGKLAGKLDAQAVSASAGTEVRRNGLLPNRDRLTAGVDLGDQWSSYCIVGLFFA